AAMRLLESVELPTEAVPGYNPIYNPGGPGRTPDAGTVYTRPALPQLFPIAQALDAPQTVSYAAQTLESYDLDEDLPVVFHLQAPGAADILTSNAQHATALIDDEGYALVQVAFANETARPGVRDVIGYVSDSGDRLYTLDASEQTQLDADARWTREGRAFGAFAESWPGLAPVHRFYDTGTGRHFFTADKQAGQHAEYQGVAWQAALFVQPEPAPARSRSSGGSVSLFGLLGMTLLWWRRRSA